MTTKQKLSFVWLVLIYHAIDCLSYSADEMLDEGKKHFSKN